MEHLTKETFKEKVFDFEKNKDWKFAGNLPCIIDFYADSCGPCKMVAPLLEELSKEFDGKINIYKVDTEAEHELSAVLRDTEHTFLIVLPDRRQTSNGNGSIA